MCSVYLLVLLELEIVWAQSMWSPLGMLVCGCIGRPSGVVVTGGFDHWESLGVSCTEAQCCSSSRHGLLEVLEGSHTRIAFVKLLKL